MITIQLITANQNIIVRDVMGNIHDFYVQLVYNKRWIKWFLDKVKGKQNMMNKKNLIKNI